MGTGLEAHLSACCPFGSNMFSLGSFSQRLASQLRKCHKNLRTDKDLAQFCIGTNIHGLSECFRADSWMRRLFWYLTFITALMMGVVCSVQIVRQYHKSPLIVSYTVHAEENFSHRLPDILICPFGRFNMTFFQQNHVSQELIDYIQEIFTINPPYRYYWDWRERNKVNFTGNDSAKSDREYPAVAVELDKLQLRLGRISFEELMDLASFNCSHLVQYCVNPSGDIEDCCQGAKTFYQPPGKCYLIKGQQQNLGGVGYGLTVVIKTPPGDQITWGRRVLHNSGVSVQLVPATNGPESDLTFIPSGVHAVMPLKAIKYEFMNDPPHFDCKVDTQIDYSPSQCLDECLFERYLNSCNCRLLVVKSHGIPACTPWLQTECFLRRFYQTSKELRGDRFRLCQQRCQQPCHYWSYQPTVSYANFAESVDLQSSIDTDWSRYVVLDVFYEKLEYTTIKHHRSAVSITLMANIGSQVSLWIGGSVLSLAEIICLLLKLIKKWYRGHRTTANHDNDEFWF